MLITLCVFNVDALFERADDVAYVDMCCNVCYGGMYEIDLNPTLINL